MYRPYILFHDTYHYMQLILFYSILAFTMTSTEAILQMLVFKWIRFTMWMLKFPKVLLLLIMSYLQGVVKVCLAGEIVQAFSCLLQAENDK